jgi:hypothetical protein
MKLQFSGEIFNLTPQFGETDHHIAEPDFRDRDVPVTQEPRILVSFN